MEEELNNFLTWLTKGCEHYKIHTFNEFGGSMREGNDLKELVKQYLKQKDE